MMVDGPNNSVYEVNILADPSGSVVAEYTRSGQVGEAGSWAVEGIGEDFIPSIADLSTVRHAYSISDEELRLICRDRLGDIERGLEAMLGWLRSNPHRIDRAV